MRDVVVRYAAAVRGRTPTAAVDGVTLDVAPGEILALLGPSGSGKSSLLRAVAGLEPLAGGDVTWDGSSVVGVPVHRRGFGLLFQDGQLFAHRDVGGNVGYGLRGTPDAAARVAELLELVGLPGEERRDPATLSGGERQRVALARALAPRPRVLLLDEPLSALDRALRERLADDLRAALVATGTTAVLVTHDQDEAFVVGDRVAVMGGGRLLQVDRPGELWRHPVSRAVAAFLGYEAFVRVASPAAAPFRAALAGAGERASGAVVRGGERAGSAASAGPCLAAPAEDALAARADDAPAARVDDAFAAPADDAPAALALAPGALAPDPRGTVTGSVVSVGARRGRAEVVVDVPGVGRLTAFAAVGWSAPVGAGVTFRVEPDAVAVVASALDRGDR